MGVSICKANPLDAAAGLAVREQSSQRVIHRHHVFDEVQFERRIGHAFGRAVTIALIDGALDATWPLRRLDPVDRYRLAMTLVDPDSLIEDKVFVAYGSNSR